ncbi:hypothetical protein F5B22DRAFT_641560 [Xylaria bambusicola]|uniref:uncharacterized protein n=1 Tax=Xylaria bambusicola TaxID=326684 RepID=UPI00200895EB|nr:uncharacterized protein F5B22DRAFT_641560 [Xylaria bambusicola]KAI0526414.1 hypothetical protein F5B22DRAFT_641560 [Xylaria bambusicola]
MPSPMVKATLASVALSGASNFLSQVLEAYQDERSFSFDVAMFLRFMTVTFIVTPPNYMWQELLECTFPTYEHRRPSAGSDNARDLERQTIETALKAGVGPEPKPSLNLKNTFTKCFIDCITLGALVNTVVFFVLMGLLKRQSVSVIGHNICTETIPVIIAGYKIWPLASIIAYSCIPVERRMVFFNFVGLLWGIYMSLVASAT